MADIVHKRTRHAARQLFEQWCDLQEVFDGFDGEGLLDSVRPAEGGYGHTEIIESYNEAVDWSNSTQVELGLRAWQQVLRRHDRWIDDHEMDLLLHLKACLDEDGFVLDTTTMAISRAVSFPELPLDQLSDATAIEEHLTRLDKTALTGPALAISSAKAVLEATCKLVLQDLDETYDERAEIPKLVRAVQSALKVDPGSVAPTARGRETIIRTLSSLSQVALGVAELRNEYGPDHGRTTSTTGLSTRHAHIAVGSSQVFCRFLLETLRDRRR